MAIFLPAAPNSWERPQGYSYTRTNVQRLFSSNGTLLSAHLFSSSYSLPFSSSSANHYFLIFNRGIDNKNYLKYDRSIAREKRKNARKIWMEWLIKGTRKKEWFLETDSEADYQSKIKKKVKRTREASDRSWNTRRHENDREGTGSSNWEEERLGNCGGKEKKEKREDERHVCQACGWETPGAADRPIRPRLRCASTLRTVPNRTQSNRTTPYHMASHTLPSRIGLRRSNDRGKTVGCILFRIVAEQAPRRLHVLSYKPQERGDHLFLRTNTRFGELEIERPRGHTLPSREHHSFAGKWKRASSSYLNR